MFFSTKFVRISGIGFFYFNANFFSRTPGFLGGWFAWAGILNVAGINADINGFQIRLIYYISYIWRASGTPEICSSPGFRSRRNSGAISLSSKGKSHSTQASTFDLGVLLPYNFFWLLKLYGFFFLLNNFDMKWKFLFRFLFLFLHLLGCPFCRSLQGVTFRSG